MTQPVHKDPLVAAYFAVDFQNGVVGAFRECNGLGSESQVVEYRATDARGKPILIREPGTMKYTDIVLKRGITDSMDMWQWRKQVEDGDIEGARRSGTITLYNQRGEAIARWNFERAWPQKLNGPTYDAKTNEVAIEELTITHEGYKRVQ
ncbi:MULTISPECIES: phage tail protein [Deinococcus]|jgi:phage tail-like protein|uniref:phage tail protein n=1 Tax=Deinococcus TaxID=1298 RepID=UPI000319DF82|nr:MULTISPECIES: phage tail protein [Deinococcus]